MIRILIAALAATLLAGCGGGEEEAGGLTADERRRLENIAERLDEGSREVHQILEADAPAQDEAVAGETDNENGL